MDDIRNQWYPHKWTSLGGEGIIAHQMVTVAIWGTINYFLVTKDDYGTIYNVPAIITLACVMIAIYGA